MSPSHEFPERARRRAQQTLDRIAQRLLAEALR